MNKADNSRRFPPGGVLFGASSERLYRLDRQPPGPSLSPWIETLWTVSWQLDKPHVQVNLPDPCVHLTVESDGGVWVYGPVKGRFVRTLATRGWVQGIKFHPGAFRALGAVPIRTLVGRRVRAESLLGDRIVEGLRTWTGDTPIAVRKTAVSAWLDANRVDPLAREIHAWVDWIRSTRAVCRVSQLSTHTGRTERNLQRLFSSYLGVNPKWVILRYRIHEALADIEANPNLSWIDLAYRLGFSDQAHFCRDFKRLVGFAPEAYRTELMRRD